MAKEVKTVSGPVDIALEVPGSKSITQRSFLCAALAEGESLLKGALFSEDTELLLSALKASGVGLKQESGLLKFVGVSGRPAFSSSERVFFGNNGTGSRFFLAYASLAGAGSVEVYGRPRLHERPMKPLLEALRKLGARITPLEKDGYLPVRIEPGTLRGGSLRLSTKESSQFLSALLLIGPYLEGGISIEVEDELVSAPYVELTLDVMRAFGAEVKREGRTFSVKEGTYSGRTYEVEGDASSASYFLIIPAVLGGRVRIKNLSLRSKQADVLLLKVLDEAGGRVYEDEGVVVEFSKEPETFEVDIRDAPDLFPTLCVLAVFCKGRSRIYGAPHLRYKECDRIGAMVRELKKCGVRIRELPDGAEVEGGVRVHGAELDTYDDHRIAMSLSVLGLAVPGVVIRDPECVAKSFPNFWDLLDLVREEGQK